MKTPFVRGMAFIACISNVQAMGSQNENFESPLDVFRGPGGDEWWTHNIIEIQALICQQITALLGTNSEGKLNLLRSKTTDEVLSYAQQIAKLLEAARFNPNLYLWATSEGLAAALRPEDFDGCEKDPHNPQMTNFDRLLSEIADASDSVTNRFFAEGPQ